METPASFVVSARRGSEEVSVACVLKATLKEEVQKLLVAKEDGHFINDGLLRQFFELETHLLLDSYRLRQVRLEFDADVTGRMVAPPLTVAFFWGGVETVRQPVYVVRKNKRKNYCREGKVLHECIGRFVLFLAYCGRSRRPEMFARCAQGGSVQSRLCV